PEVGAADGQVRSNHAIALDPPVDLSATTNTGGISEEIPPSLVEGDRIDRIPGGSRHIADHHSVFPEHGAHQRRFADIPASHAGNAGHLRLVSVLIRAR